MGNGANRLYEFGPYRLDPRRNVLFRSSAQIPLTTKAFEYLLVLIEHGDDGVLKGVDGDAGSEYPRYVAVSPTSIASKFAGVSWHRAEIPIQSVFNFS